MKNIKPQTFLNFIAGNVRETKILLKTATDYECSKYGDTFA